MKNGWNGKFLYSFGGIVLCLFLIVGLVHMIMENSVPKHEKKEERTQENVEKKEQKKEKPEKNVSETKIRVLLRTNGFADEVHPSVTVSAENGLFVTFSGGKKETGAKEKITIHPDDMMFSKGTIHIQAKKQGEKIMISGLKRGYGEPSYRGELELFQTPQGIAVINELSLEEYLYGVVPSEMPASYESEALKCQAVCARSYAYCHIQGQAYPEYRANVDDSTAYQVYGNSKEQQKTIEAVNATKGQKMKYNGKVVKAYYYSTSCGKTTTVEAWGTKVNKDNEYLKASDIAENGQYYEKDLPWFSWKCDIPTSLLSDLFAVNTGKNVGTIQNVEITKRGPGNVAVEMKITGEKGSYTVQTENKIRSAFGGKGYQIIRQDGSKVSASALLPSAFFHITKQKDSFHIEGGGYGHGIGMSQNGANEMAKKGKDYHTILKTFYPGVEITVD